jgi:hypothetical protein
MGYREWVATGDVVDDDGVIHHKGVAVISIDGKDSWEMVKTHFVNVMAGEIVSGRGWSQSAGALSMFLLRGGGSQHTPMPNNPCQHVNPADLDYSQKRQYGGKKGVTETAEEHIIRRHGSGPISTLKPGEQGPVVSATSYYISSPPTSGKQMFDDYIKYLNNATFNRPTEVRKLANGDYLFVKDFPPIKVLPFVPATARYIGWDRATFDRTSRNNLIVGSDCKAVQTSYPGTT